MLEREEDVAVYMLLPTVVSLSKFNRASEIIYSVKQDDKEQSSSVWSY